MRAREEGIITEDTTIGEIDQKASGRALAVNLSWQDFQGTLKWVATLVGVAKAFAAKAYSQEDHG